MITVQNLVLIAVVITYFGKYLKFCFLSNLQSLDLLVKLISMSYTLKSIDKSKDFKCFALKLLHCIACMIDKNEILYCGLNDYIRTNPRAFLYYTSVIIRKSLLMLIILRVHTNFRMIFM